MLNRRHSRGRTLTCAALALLLAACSDDEGTKPPDEDVFAPTQNTTLGGNRRFDEVHIPDGVTVTVTDDLVLRVRGALEIGGILHGPSKRIHIVVDGPTSITGAIRNMGSVSLDDPAPITLSGHGAMQIDGAHFESSGPIVIDNDSTLTDSDFPDSTGGRAETAPLGDDLPIVVVRNADFLATPVHAMDGSAGQFGGPGHDASTFSLRCRGHLQLLGGNLIRGQAGGAGGAGHHESGTAANATGGDGGDGGLIRVLATGDIICDGTNTVESGAGGAGGSAEAIGQPRAGGGAAASATARGGKGARPGLIELRAGGSISVEGELSFNVGAAGSGGDAGAAGADGRNAGTEAAQAGGSASATGGDGGSSPNLRLVARGGVFGAGNVIVAGGDGGNGGVAEVLAGNGGVGNAEFPPGGAGGNLAVHGGDGGNADVRDRTGSRVGQGGSGGTALVSGGNGGNGFIDCQESILPGGDGGQGGTATGRDGRKGVGLSDGAHGGMEIDTAGNGGNGGDGVPPGVLGEGGDDQLSPLGDVLRVGTSFADGTSGIPCPPTLGACCASDGSCTITNEQACLGREGVFQGIGTTCDPNPCPEPGGACCFDDGACEITLEDDCHGGVWQGANTSCAPNPCPAPTGACCFPTAPCAVISAALCESNDGRYLGDGTSCDPNPCTSGTGACCFGDAQCAVVTPEGCEIRAGEYLGGGVPCDPDPCGQPASGACCSSSGSCEVATASDCSEGNGVYQGDGTVCTPNPCEVPVEGACCLNSSECVITTPEACAEGGIYLGDNTTCEGAPCIQAGACCRAGHCFLVLREEECGQEGDVFFGIGTTCEGRACGELGACCAPNGQCQLTGLDGCDGTFQGIGTECAPNPCPVLGACCTYDGACELTGEQACVGYYLGLGSVCDPNPCLHFTDGSYGSEVLVDDDPFHHDGFTLWSSITKINWNMNGNVATVSGAFPLVSMSGVVDPQGTYVLLGSGTVAGRQNVSCRMTGKIAPLGEGFQIHGQIKLGNDTAPFQLPNGPVTYTYEGMHR